MMAAVSEENLEGLRIGMPVTIRVRAYPGETFGGQIVQLGPELDPATRMLTVRVLVPNRGRPPAAPDVRDGGNRARRLA